MELFQKLFQIVSPNKVTIPFFVAFFGFCSFETVFPLFFSYESVPSNINPIAVTMETWIEGRKKLQKTQKGSDIYCLIAIFIFIIILIQKKIYQKLILY